MFSGSYRLNKFRIIGIILAIALLLWLPFEDTELTLVLVFSILLSSFIFINIFTRSKNAHRARGSTFIITGFLAGFCVALIGILLVILKIGFHAHPTPDFNVAQIIYLVKLTPIFTLSGVLIGLGCYMVQRARVKTLVN